MATVIGAVTALIDAAWRTATVAAPVLSLLFLGTVTRRHAVTYDTVIGSQRDLPVRYGEALTGATVVAGVAALYLGTVGTWLGAAGIVAVAAWCAWGDDASIGDGIGWPAAWWLAVPVLAAAGILLQHLLLQQLVAVAVYGTIFWRL